jgi:hypothetical protein
VIESVVLNVVYLKKLSLMKFFSVNRVRVDTARWAGRVVVPARHDTMPFVSCSCRGFCTPANTTRHER